MKRHTTFTPDGKVVLNLAGLSPKNEQDTREVSEFLATFLNDRGINATLCTENPNKKAEKNKEQGVDHWLLIDGKPVGIQVVRALRTPEFWKKLNHDGKVSELYLTPQQCADSLREAITHKEPKIGREQRPNLILLLDAYRIPAFALGPVVKQFKEVHTATVRELGFHSVYVVGPTSAFVSRLDQ
ncbi:MAG: hypothetical protein K8U57_18520 [Planctomycetes bacterium]|nr:hypothetical protein [Planctomycetota bacterium]